MRSRLLATVLSLVVLVLLGLGVPLALSMASSEQQRMFLDRLTATARLASLAQRPLLDDHPQALGPVLRRYEDVYGIASAVVNQDGKLAARSPHGPLTTSEVGGIDDALAGRRPEPAALLMPWDSTPLVLAEPVLVDGEVRGAAVTVSPTDALRSRVLVWWAIVVVGGLCALALAILLALPVVRWILRPVRRLDEATGRVAAAVAGGDPFTPVAADSGPPELRKLVRSFDNMAVSVSDVLAAQRSFVADASHQLRNPLTALQIRLSNLEGEVTEDAGEDYTAAVAEARRLHQTLEELLAMARAESGSADPVIIDAGAVLAERVAAWQAVATAAGVRLRLNAPAELYVVAVPRAVDSVLDALLDNALKFGADGGVEVTARRDGDTVTISVRDHGPGLDPDELGRATDRFWRSPSHQNVTGTGLGLAIVQRVVERSGGNMRLELPDGGGLEVLIVLPAG